MSLSADCPGCAQGDHDRHVGPWNITKGLIGGTYCDCTGDCFERSNETFEHALAGLGIPTKEKP